MLLSILLGRLLQPAAWPLLYCTPPCHLLPLRLLLASTPPLGVHAGLCLPISHRHCSGGLHQLTHLCEPTGLALVVCTGLALVIHASISHGVDVWRVDTVLTMVSIKHFSAVCIRKCHILTYITHIQCLTLSCPVSRCHLLHFTLSPSTAHTQPTCTIQCSLHGPTSITTTTTQLLSLCPTQCPSLSPPVSYLSTRLIRRHLTLASMMPFLSILLTRCPPFP